MDPDIYLQANQIKLKQKNIALVQSDITAGTVNASTLEQAYTLLGGDTYETYIANLQAALDAKIVDLQTEFDAL